MSQSGSSSPVVSSTTIAALVNTLGCSNGVTGDVLRSTDEMGETHVVVTSFDTTLDSDLQQTCPGHDDVPDEVTADRPLGGLSALGRATPKRSRTGIDLLLPSRRRGSRVAPRFGGPTREAGATWMAERRRTPRLPSLTRVAPMAGLYFQR